MRSAPSTARQLELIKLLSATLPTLYVNKVADFLVHHQGLEPRTRRFSLISDASLKQKPDYIITLVYVRQVKLSFLNSGCTQYIVLGAYSCY